MAQLGAVICEARTSGKAGANKAVRVLLAQRVLTKAVIRENGPSIAHAFVVQIMNRAPKPIGAPLHPRLGFCLVVFELRHTFHRILGCTAEHSMVGVPLALRGR